MTGLKQELSRYATEIGIDLLGVCSPEPFGRYLAELDKRKHHYAGRFGHRLETWRRLADPRSALPGARSVVVVGFYFLTSEEEEPKRGCGRFGRIVTHGHLGVLRRARLIVSFLEGKGVRAVMGAHRKEAAVRAGLGWIGKNGLVINGDYGSWVAYQSIVTDSVMEFDESVEDTFCGDCRACLDACPTEALYEPYRLDPRRCVTCLLTAECIERQYWEHMPNYIMGCDLCQEACPVNRGLARKEHVESVLPACLGDRPPLVRVLGLTENAFQGRIMSHVYGKVADSRLVGLIMRSRFLREFYRRRMKKNAVHREEVPETFVYATGKLLPYQRNAIIAAANLNDRGTASELRRFIDHPVLGRYARWAVERIG